MNGPAAASLSPSPPAMGERRSTVLLIDDNATVSWLVSSLLERAGHRVLTASGALQGMSLAYLERPDVVVLDLGLPFLDGLQICRVLRERETTRHIPVLVLSGENSASARERARSLGVEAWLPKTSSAEQIVEAVARHATAARESTVGERGVSR